MPTTLCAPSLTTLHHFADTGTASDGRVQHSPKLIDLAIVPSTRVPTPRDDGACTSTNQPPSQPFASCAACPPASSSRPQRTRRRECPGIGHGTDSTARSDPGSRAPGVHAHRSTAWRAPVPFCPVGAGASCPFHGGAAQLLPVRAWAASTRAAADGRMGRGEGHAVKPPRLGIGVVLLEAGLAEGAHWTLDTAQDRHHRTRWRSERRPQRHICGECDSDGGTRGTLARHAPDVCVSHVRLPPPPTIVRSPPHSLGRRARMRGPSPSRTGSVQRTPSPRTHVRRRAQLQV